jgi:Domain of unknown function (DUF4157)
MHDQDYVTADDRRRAKGAAAHGRDDAWEGARRAAAGGDGSAVSPGAMLRLQRLAGNAGVGSLVGNEEEEAPAQSPVLDVVGKGGGSPLSNTVRTDMEQHLGADFGDVRVHDDGAAAASAGAVSAKAYTVGNEVVFNNGAFQPESEAGRHTLAHELVHVMQQRSGPVEGTPTGDGVAVSHPSDRFEQEAEARASSLSRVGEASASAPAPAQRQAEEEEEPVQALALQRQEDEEEDESMQATPLQRQEDEEDESMQETPLQRQEEEEDESMQAMALQREAMSEEDELPAT